PEWTRFFGHSHQLWLGLSRRLGHNVMYTQRGYAILAESDRTAAVIEESLQVQRDCGVASYPLSQEDLARRIPILDRRRVKSAMIFEDGGTAPHHALMKGLRAACEERRAALNYRTAMTGIERQN